MVRTAAAPSTPTVVELAPRLSDHHWRVRAETAESLASLGALADLAVPRIGQQLEDQNGRARRAAACALGELSVAEVWGRKPGAIAAYAVPELVTRLADPDLNVRRAVRGPLEELRAEGAIGDLSAVAAPAVPELARRLEDEDWTLRESAAHTVGELGAVAAAAIPLVAARVADESHQVRKAAKGALERLCAAKGVKDLRAFGFPAAAFLQERLGHEDWRVRCAAAWGLGAVGGAAAVGARKLQETLGHKDWEIRLLSLEALGNLGTGATPALARFAECLHDGVASVRAAAKIVLTKLVCLLGDCGALEVASLDYLVRRFEEENARVRQSSAEELGKLGAAAAPAIPELAELLLDEDPDVRRAAAQAIEQLAEAGALGSFDDGRVEGSPPLRIGAALCRALTDEHWAVSLHAAEALANLMAVASPAVVRLTTRCEDEDASVKAATNRLLTMLRKEGAILDFGDIMDQVVPILAERLLAPDGDPLRGLALAALGKLNAAGVLADPEGELTDPME